jgi:hypothetical protein
MKNFGLNSKQNHQLIFLPKIPYDLVAETRRRRGEALTFPTWCTILKIVRTFFAAEGGEGKPP